MIEPKIKPGKIYILTEYQPSKEELLRYERAGVECVILDNSKINDGIALGDGDSLVGFSIGHDGIVTVKDGNKNDNPKT